MSPSEVHELQAKMNKEDQVSKTNLMVSPGSILKTLSAQGTVLLMVLKECLSIGSSDLQLPKQPQAVLDKFQDLFPEEIYQLDYLQSEGLSTKLI